MSLILGDYGSEKYRGSDGRIDSKFRSADTLADSVNPLSSLSHLLTGRETDGAYGIFRLDFGSGPGGTNTHFHRTFHEDVFILTGSMALFDGERWREAGPGDFLHVPPGGLHAFKNTSGEPGSMLMFFSPGGPREDYFAAGSELASLDAQQRRDFLIQHDNWFVDEGGGPVLR